MKHTVNIGIIKTLGIAWLGSVLAAITLKLYMFRILVPLLMLALFGYLAFCSIVVFTQGDSEGQEDPEEGEKDV